MVSLLAAYYFTFVGFDVILVGNNEPLPGSMVNLFSVVLAYLVLYLLTAYCIACAISCLLLNIMLSIYYVLNYSFFLLPLM